jgi:DNA (cytosine-5)-methyltransferase 1
LTDSISQSLRVAELFAGVGGFRLGLENAGHRVVFSNQWEPSTKRQHASSAYVAKFGDEGHSCEDIAQVDSLPANVDLIVGGFPCQDYSVAKSASASSGIEGKKGVLWWEIQRLVEQSKPAYVFLENVDRLLKSPASQRGRDFAIMLRSLGDIGYQIEWKVVNSADYGFPQRRKRVFILATKLGLCPSVSQNNFLGGKGILDRAFPGTTVSSVQEFQITGDLVSLSSNFNRTDGRSPFLSTGFYHGGTVLTANYQATFDGEKLALKSVLQDECEIDPGFFVEESRVAEWEYLKGAKQIDRAHKVSGFNYKYSEGKMAFPDSIDSPSRTVLTAEGGSSPSRFKHIVRVNNRLRRLTPVELERLNGFPDDWTKFDSDGNVISDTRRAFFMGNALVVGLVQRVGEVLSSIETRS